MKRVINFGSYTMSRQLEILERKTDSEQVIRMEFAGGEINASHSGALQDFEIRDAICDVMEKERLWRVDIIELLKLLNR